MDNVSPGDVWKERGDNAGSEAGIGALGYASAVGAVLAAPLHSFRGELHQLMTRSFRAGVAPAALLLFVAACGGGSASQPATTGSRTPAAAPSTTAAATDSPTSTPASSPATTPDTDRQPEKLIAKGRVTNSAGEPLPGVVVTADYQLYENVGLDGTTDQNGDYRIELDPEIGSWRMNAKYTTTYHEIDYGFDMHPLDDSDFAGLDGGVRDFVWRLSGPTPDADFGYGATILVYIDFDDYELLPQNVELTLAPDGPLVDGSAGRTITVTGDSVQDIPVGRYAYSARYVEAGKPPFALDVRVRDTGDYVPTLTADFKQVSSTGQGLELQVRRHAA